MTGREIVTVWVPGIPKTKGSMNHIGNGQMEESVANTGWRRQIAARVRAALGARSDAKPEDLPYEPVAVPVEVGCLFVLPTPRSHVAMPAAAWPRSGDVDKEIRLVGDALSALHPKDAWLIADDNLIVRWIDPVKVSSAQVDTPPGCLITVRTVDIGLLNAMAHATLRRHGVKAFEPGYAGF